jgi:hypothetical protein
VTENLERLRRAVTAEFGECAAWRPLIAASRRELMTIQAIQTGNTPIEWERDPPLHASERRA